MKNKTKAILGTVAVAGVIGISGVIAYLTDTDTASNQFTVGQVKIDLQEPNWDAATDENGNKIPDYAENIVPNATITKDPQVKNVGSNDAYIYLKVTVPAKSVITAGADGTLINEGRPQDTQLFTYTAKANWTEITSQRKTNTNEAGETESYTYVYYYNEKVAPNATTETLFDTVTFANVIEEQIDLSNHQIDIDAYAIQSDNLPADTTIESAYSIYVNQNK